MFFSFDNIFRLPRPIKRTITLLFDASFIFIAYWGAWVIRIDSSKVFFDTDKWILFALIMPLTLFSFIRLGLYRAVLRYIGPKVTFSVLTGIAISVFFLVFVSYFFQLTPPRAIPILYGIFLVLFIGGSRFSVRMLNMHSNKADKRRVAIYGSGPSGRQLAQALMNGKDFDPIAFIDDDKNLQNTYILGRPVYSLAELELLLKEVSIEQVLLAMPNINRDERSQIISKLEPLALEVKSIPNMTDLVSGIAKIDELRDIAIDDLLGRDAVEPDKALMNKNIKGKVVMVTGAGGSIGSELCRQIILLKPKVLVLFEISEFSLYKIDSELTKLIKTNNIDTIIKPLIGSVQNKKTVKTVLTAFSVQTVYHAAAYKHVPLVEYNVIEGVRNNLFGTYYAASSALEANVETFVLVSTDKAVRPTNIMGTTKRLAELCLQSLSQISTTTVFSMVRFGNVLGSSGSVVPLFSEQIKKGGPITVTHKEITRFFMTIPEASQLVIQASSMARGGDVFVLDMGDAVKIYDLAVKMIHLSGLELKDTENPDGDIAINFTGLRPGEKLFEELLIGDGIIATEHQRILSANEDFLSFDEMEKLLITIENACSNFDIIKIHQILLETPTGYSPNSKLCDLLWTECHESQPLH